MNNAQECLNRLCTELLGEDYYISKPVSVNQANSIITEDIIRLYNNITYKDIMLKFKSMFPMYLREMCDYRPQADQNHSIHIWMKDGSEFIFMYRNGNDWLFETYEHFKMRYNKEEE